MSALCATSGLLHCGAAAHGEVREVKLGGFNAATQDASGTCGSARNETTTA